MCWSNCMATPIILKKPLRVYKTGSSTVLDGFISSYQDFIYRKYKVQPTIEINPIFERRFIPVSLLEGPWDLDIFYILEGYHSYLTKEMAELRRDKLEKIGMFEIPAGANVSNAGALSGFRSVNSKKAALHISKWFGRLLFEVIYGGTNCDWIWID